MGVALALERVIDTNLIVLYKMLITVTVIKSS